jgi:cell division septation protein DedD
MNRKYLVAAALLIATAGPLSAQSVKAGIEAWQRSDYAGAVEIWRPLAEKGDPDAEFNLGQAYRLGRGVATNLAAAKTWFERAANQGHVDAETTLGLLLFQNQDQAEGLKWLKKAAEQGEPRALLVYGTALVNGDSVTQDPVLGYAYVSRAAAQGLEPAKQTLDQLDQLLSAADRKRGAEMARQQAKAAPSQASTGEPAAKPVKTAKAKVPAAPKTSARKAKAVETAAAEEPAKPSEPPAAKEPPKRTEIAAAEEPAAPAEPPAAKKASKRKETAAAKEATTKAAKTALAKAAPAKDATAKAAPIKAAPPAKGDWRIQLGAFSQRANAEALYKKLSAKSALAGREPFYVSAGSVTRLQVGPFESKAAAEAACRSLGVSCFAVPKK